jgi:DNA-binding beta-propeller fold protein YncE
MVYVADTGNNRILIYTSTGGAKRVITGSKLGQSSDKKNRLYMPRDVAVDDDNMVYVIDSKHRLLIFDASGNLKQQFGSKGKALNQFNHANSIAITPFLDENRKLYYYIADTLNKRVLKFSKTNKLIFAANEKGVMETMNDPRGVAVTENGDFFVADTGRIPVVAYKSNGVISAIAGVFGAGKGKILKPGGIAYSKTNNKIYVTDTLQNKILVYSVK